MFAKIVGYFAIVFLVLNLFPTLTSSETNDKVKPRIVGGTNGNIGSLPYLLQMWKNNSFICGATLVSKRYAVSAAHCVLNGKPAQFTIVGGATTLAQPGVRRKVVQIMVHPTYNPNTFDCDVAVLKLAEPMEGPKIRTIKLNTKTLLEGKMLKVSGWGLKRGNESQPTNHIRTVRVRIMPKEKCRAQYVNIRRITSSMTCASKPGQKDACSGDSGGPAACDGKLCGVVSWGRGCAVPGYAGVYTNVSSVLGFIEDSMVE